MANRPPRAVRPLDPQALDRMALHYVARYATTRAKLLRYLARKIAERGWSGDEAPHPDAVADRIVDLGYIDDAAFAQSRADALFRRGYGEARVRGALRAAGVGDEPRSDDPAQRWQAALALARRKRIGPYAQAAMPADAARRATAAMMRAGHPPDLVRRIIACAPGDVPEDFD